MYFNQRFSNSYAEKKSFYQYTNTLPADDPLQPRSPSSSKRNKQNVTQNVYLYAARPRHSCLNFTLRTKLANTGNYTVVQIIFAARPPHIQNSKYDRTPACIPPTQLQTLIVAL